MKLAGDGGTLLHHDQLLLFLLVAVERQRGRELLNKRIDQLLLVVAQVTSGGQGGQQNTILGMAVHQPPLEGRAAGGKRRQAARAQMTPFIVAGDVRLTGKFLMIFLIFNVVNPKLKIAEQSQILQAVQYRRETFAKRDLHMQATVCLPEEREDLVFLLKPGGFLLDALFQYRVAF